jgi:hypothetical protein
MEDFMERIFYFAGLLRKAIFSMQTLLGLYVALVVTMSVMGLRSSLFISVLTPAFTYQVGDVRLSLLGVAIAISFVLFVASGSYYVGMLQPGSPERRTANLIRLLAVFGDGLFNLVEVIYAIVGENRTTGVFDTFNPASAPDSATATIYWGVRITVVLGIAAIGIVPTLLAFFSSELLGALQQQADKVKAHAVYLSESDWKILKETYATVGMKWFAPAKLNAFFKQEDGAVEIVFDKAVELGFMTKSAHGRFRFTNVNIAGL